ncbi:YgjV family protein [Desulforhopalus singaporensis]|uniref:Inner membrane protein n=1 Tax=Desulforhopalus singaporensis TaxID=91360 RepID=A0A1H0L8T6_9BACT|nr:YgjV family protein [Desulforhopalus singaporensis]SDO64627.1 inner membrane protein [Desulforhopalus singaporensis]
MTLFTLSQILVGIAICTDIVSFQFKKKAHIVCCLLISCILIAVHFACLGHWTAALLGMLAAGRFAISLFTTSKLCMALFISAAVVASLLTFEGMLSILSCSGAVFGTIASFSREDKQLRRLMMVATTFWLIHNFLAGSPAAVIMECIFLGSNLVGYFRYYIRTPNRAFGL